MPLFPTHAFYGILDTAYVAKGDWIEKYEALVAGGASVVQVRAKSANAQEHKLLLDQVIEHRKKSANDQPPLVVNNDIELALSYRDLGLHISHHEFSPREIRERLGPDRVLGLSAHSPDQVDAAVAHGPEILSYFSVGPVFPSRTKPDNSPVGLELVKYVAGKQPKLPFFCVGGINRQNIDRIRSAGATRIVTVADVLCVPDTALAVRQSIAALKG